MAILESIRAMVPDHDARVQNLEVNYDNDTDTYLYTCNS